VEGELRWQQHYLSYRYSRGAKEQLYSEIYGRFVLQCKKKPSGWYVGYKHAEDIELALNRA